MSLGQNERCIDNYKESYTYYPTLCGMPIDESLLSTELHKEQIGLGSNARRELNYLGTVSLSSQHYHTLGEMRVTERMAGSSF